MPKQMFTVTIPEQEYNILADNEQDAIDMILDYGIDMEAFPMKIADIMSKLPKEGCDINYYVTRLMAKNTDINFKGYVRLNDRCIFTNGHILISVRKDLVDISGYSELIILKDETEENWGNYVSDSAWKRCSHSIRPDIKKVVEKAENNIRYGARKPYIICSDGVIHGINPLYLLEALYATGSDEIRFTESEKSMFMTKAQDNSVIICILPVSLTNGSKYAIDQEE